MPHFADWLPALSVGVSFTAVGLLKVYGLSRGIVGGGSQPAADRLCGTCPSWSHRVNVAMTCLFLAIGLVNLTYLAWVMLNQSA